METGKVILRLENQITDLLFALKYIIKSKVEDSFDHKNLNLEVEEFKNLNPTAENISVVIYNKIKPKLKPDLELEVELYETPRNFVSDTLGMISSPDLTIVSGSFCLGFGGISM